jgi:hypothetical protein
MVALMALGSSFADAVVDGTQPHSEKYWRTANCLRPNRASAILRAFSKIVGAELTNCGMDRLFGSFV